ncbi:MAG: M28 family peptidase [Myxococcota bacterium]
MWIGWLWVSVIAAKPPCGTNGGTGCLDRARAAHLLGQTQKAHRFERWACTPEALEACERLYERRPDLVEPVVDEAQDGCHGGPPMGKLCRSLGRWYRSGPVGARDDQAAHAALQHACDAGDRRACGELADHDPERRRQWLGLGCEADDRHSCHRLALSLIQGQGGAVSVTQAYGALTKACDLDAPKACEQLGQWHAQGRGRPPEPARAVRAFSLACKLDPTVCSEAAHTLAAFNDVDRSAFVKQLFEQCDADHAQACAGLWLLEVSPLPDEARLTAALSWACYHHHGKACEALVNESPGANTAFASYRAQVLRQDSEPVTVEQPPPWLPARPPIERCIAQHLPALVRPDQLGRATRSPGFTAAADYVAGQFQALGFSVERPEVPVPNVKHGSWVAIDGVVYEAWAVAGAATGPFAGPVTVLDAEPTRANLDAGSATLFAVPNLEANAVGTYVRSDQPVLAVRPDVLEKARRANRVVGMASRSPDATTENVIGTLPGRGPLASEVVMLGAHLDGQGFEFDGRIRPSADDNASGVAGLLCAAQALTGSLPQDKSRRTLVFVAFGGEEDGLYGSQAAAWTADPLPVAMMNLDMIGRLGSGPLRTRAYGEAWRTLIGPAAKSLGHPIVPDGTEGTSDHLPFVLQGVPSVHLTSGPHGDYHRATDTLQRVDEAGVATVTMITAATLAQLATGARLDPASDSCTELVHGRAGFGWTLDVLTAPTWQVRCVREGSFAANVGVQPADRWLDEDGLYEPSTIDSITVRRTDGCWRLTQDEAPEFVRCETLE